VPLGQKQGVWEAVVAWRRNFRTKRAVERREECCFIASICVFKTVKIERSLKKIVRTGIYVPLKLVPLLPFT